MAPPQKITVNCGPSFDDIIGQLALTEEEAVEWLVEYRNSHPAPDKPLGLFALLDFGYGREFGSMSDEASDQLNDALTTGRDWALARWVQRTASLIPLEERIARAVELAASRWLPVLSAHDARNAQEVAQLLRTLVELSRNPALPRGWLKDVRTTRVGLPPSGPPPPYVGHFCAAAMHLLDAMIDPPGYEHLAQAMSFATVAPDGSSLRKEVAAIVSLR